MDWTKTKKQIIIILLILNLALLGLYQKKQADLSPYQNSDQTISQLKIRLDQANIKLQTEIPSQQVKEKPLLVKYQEEKADQVNQNYFQGQGQVQITDNITKISKDQEEITIINNRRFLYENYAQGIDQGTNTEEKALKFLLDRGYDTTDMELIKVDNQGPTTTFEFAKIYKDKILETSYTRLSLEEGRVITMDRLWIQVIEEEGEKIQIEPAYKALFALLDQEDLKGDTIEKIQVCYYFNPEEQGLLADNTKAEQGRAIPAWRVEMKSGKTRVLDNF
ncbi:MAG: two-component system regulatory protein YycI [Bacillota bacterium]|nr:two-component system regulatory protein YycI [Bacillota bacterium]